MRLRIHLVLLIFLLAGACRSTDATKVPELNENHPLTTRTGIPEIDSVLVALESGEPKKLIALINYTVAPCTTAEGLGGPPKCREGETDGTQIEALPMISGEGNFIRKNEIGSWQGIDATGIYSIYRISQNAPMEEYYPVGEYAILLTAPENHSAILIHVENGGIVRVDYLFDSSLDSLKMVMERNFAEVILAPKIR